MTASIKTVNIIKIFVVDVSDNFKCFFNVITTYKLSKTKRFKFFNKNFIF